MASAQNEFLQLWPDHNSLEPDDGRSPQEGERGQEEPDRQEGKDEEKGVEAVEEPVRHELLQFPRDPHEGVDLLPTLQVLIRILGNLVAAGNFWEEVVPYWYCKKNEEALARIQHET